MIALEESDTESTKEYKERLTGYLESLDEKKRHWEERKIDHYKSKGMKYKIPGDKDSPDEKPKKKFIDDHKVKSDGKTTSVFKMAQQATPLDKEILQDKINSMRMMMTKLKL